MKPRNLGWIPALCLRRAAMGLLSVRNASDPSFTNGSTITSRRSATPPSPSLSLLASSPCALALRRGRRRGGGVRMIGGRRSRCGLRRRGGDAARVGEFVALRSPSWLFLGEEGEREASRRGGRSVSGLLAKLVVASGPFCDNLALNQKERRSKIKQLRRK